EPGRPPSGPSWPNPEIDRVTSRGLSSARRAVPNPSRSSTPGRKFSRSTSARRSSASSTSVPSGVLRSRAMDSLLRLQDRKYVATGSPPPSGRTNGGPQCRVSSPLPGVSTLMTRAPRPASIIPAGGPASARARATTRIPDSGPLRSAPDSRGVGVGSDMAPPGAVVARSAQLGGAAGEAGRGLVCRRDAEQVDVPSLRGDQLQADGQPVDEAAGHGDRG